MMMNRMQEHYFYQSKRWYGFGFSVLIFTIGFVWLARDLGWIDSRISIWPLLLIAISLYWIISALIKNIFW
jgi:hypothetical protein